MQEKTKRLHKSAPRQIHQTNRASLGVFAHFFKSDLGIWIAVWCCLQGFSIPTGGRFYCVFTGTSVLALLNGCCVCLSIFVWATYSCHNASSRPPLSPLNKMADVFISSGVDSALPFIPPPSPPPTKSPAPMLCCAHQPRSACEAPSQLLKH